jgi:ferrous iron transport protein A
MTSVHKSLADMADGEIGVVRRFTGGMRMAERLQAMGVRPGKKVRKISRQPLRGPVAVEIDNFCVAIGHGMARRIIVTCTSGSNRGKSG